MTDKDRLLYMPDLQPNRHYESDGIIHKVPAIQENSVNVPIIDNPTLNEISTSIMALESTLPKKLYDIITGTLMPVTDLVTAPEDPLTPIETIIEPTDLVTVPEDPLDLTPIETVIGSTDVCSIELAITEIDIFPSPPDITIQIENRLNVADVLKALYAQDLYDIKKDFILKLQEIMRKYLQEMYTVQMEVGTSSLDQLIMPFDGNAVVLKNKDQQHLADFITRSQIIRDQKTRLFQKTHNIDNTVIHFRSCEMAYQTRTRYYAENYSTSGTFLATGSNNLLHESRESCNNKYKSSMYGLYKYLNSAVISVGDNLNATSKEAQAKGALLKSGVNIYTTTASVEAEKTKAAEAAKAKATAAEKTKTASLAEKALEAKNAEANKVVEDAKNAEAAKLLDAAKAKAITLTK